MRSKKAFIQMAIWPVLIIAAVILAIAAIAWATDSVASNGNGIYNYFYSDVTSGTDVVPGCEPIRYLIDFQGTVDLINQKESTWTLDYSIDLIDVHISGIEIAQEHLGIVSNEFNSKLCLYDVLAGGDDWVKHQVECTELDGKVTKGQIEKFPFAFKYNLYDNDCNGKVDDHTFNLIAELETEDGFQTLEKTVAIVNGEAVFQNVKY